MDIDIVIPWVDGNDLKWQQDKSKYENTISGDKRIIRYRDWDNLQYWFRGVEKFLPWVRTIHFITYGHLPAWLNVENPKLHIVNHQDYIPLQYLPTFSANPIEMNIHRIEGLSDHFIYSNDDMFFIREMSPEFFFKKGLPVDSSVENVQFFKKGGIDNIIANDLAVLNEHFFKRTTLKKYFFKWLHLYYGKGVLKNIYLLPFPYFSGFDNPHLPQAFLKKTFEDLWNAEPEWMDETSSHKFRSKEYINQWLARYWQLASGNFIPGNINRGKFFSIGRDNIQIQEAITHQKFKMICLSDDSVLLDFKKEKKFIRNCFEHILPEESSFELQRDRKTGDF